MNARTRANMRYNHAGNHHDEYDGSYYVLDDEGEEVAGPFASGAYAATVRERMSDTWPLPVHVDYRP